VARIDALGGADSYEVRMPLQQLAEVQLADSDGAAAVVTLTRARKLEERLFGMGKEVAATDVLLARALLLRKGAGDAEAARQSLQEGIAIYARIQPGGAGETGARTLLASLR